MVLDTVLQGTQQSKLRLPTLHLRTAVYRESCALQMDTILRSFIPIFCKRLCTSKLFQIAQLILNSKVLAYAHRSSMHAPARTRVPEKFEF